MCDIKYEKENSNTLQFKIKNRSYSVDTMCVNFMKTLENEIYEVYISLEIFI